MKPSSEEVKAFFEQWQIYQSVVRLNYMNHKEMIEHILQNLAEKNLNDVRLLELGGGDAYITSELIKRGIKVRHYCSIDLSSMALELADKNLKDDVEERDLRCGDMVEFSKQLEPAYDVILAGYTLHHLNTDETIDVLRECKRVLEPGGLFLVYDEFRGNDETVEAYLDRALHADDIVWEGFTDAQRQQLTDHVIQYDLPKSFEEWAGITRRAGFQQSHALYETPTRLYSMFRMEP